MSFNFNEILIHNSWENPILQELISAKINYLEELKPLQDLTHYPFDLQEKSNQDIIKETVAYITEELMEAKELENTLYEYMGMNPNTFSSKVTQQIDDLIISYNEEMADVLHFHIELGLFLGFTYEDDYFAFFEEYSESAFNNPPNPNFSKNGLNNILHICRQDNIFMGELSNARINFTLKGIGLFDLESRFSTGSGLSLYTRDKLDLLKITYIFNLNRIRMALKKKYWRDNQGEIDEAQLKAYFNQANLTLFKMLDLSGATGYSISHGYAAKDIINIDRVHNKIKDLL